MRRQPYLNSKSASWTTKSRHRVLANDVGGYASILGWLRSHASSDMDSLSNLATRTCQDLLGLLNNGWGVLCRSV